MLKSFQSLFFVGFMLIYNLGTIAYLVYKLFGFDLNILIGVSVLAISIVPLLFVYFLNIAQKNSFNDSYTIKTLKLYILIMLILGLIRLNPLPIILEEIWIIVVVIVSYSLSRNETVFQVIKSWGLLIYFVSSYLIILGTNETRKYIDELNSVNAQLLDNTSTLGYEFISLLDFWPFIFLLWFFEKRFTYKLLGLLPLLIYLFFQLYFLKRAPTVRCIFQLVFAYFMIYSTKISVLRFFQFIIIFLIIGFGLYFVVPEDLIIRFANDDGSRQKEIINMFSQFSWMDYLFGRGLGGVYISDNDIVDLLGKNEYRSIVHIGAIYPILKGGLVLFLFISIYFFRLFKISFKYRRNFTPLEHASFGFLFVFLLFRMIEGPISTTTAFNGIMFGLSIGRLEYFNQIQFLRRSD